MSFGSSFVGADDAVCMNRTAGVLGHCRMVVCVTACAGTSPGTAQNVSGDKALGRTALLRLTDLPAGWSAIRRPNGPKTPGIDKELVACLHTSLPLIKHDRAKVSAPEFSNVDHGVVESELTYEVSRAQVVSDFAVLQNPQLPSCLAKAFAAVFALGIKQSSDSSLSGITLGTTRTSTVPVPPVGDQRLGYRVLLPLTDAADQINAYFDLIAVHKGRVAAVFLFESTGAAFSGTEEAHLTTRVVGRLTHT
jgi:hypothetical protein